jgi:hypothetical protein
MEYLVEGNGLDEDEPCCTEMDTPAGESREVI